MRGVGGTLKGEAATFFRMGENVLSAPRCPRRRLKTMFWSRRFTLSALLLAASAAFAAAAPSARHITVRNMRPGLWDAKGDYVRFFQGPVASLANQVQLEDINRTMGNFFRNCQENLPPSGKPETLLTYAARATISVEKPALISGYITRTEDTGGAHPMTFFEGFTVGLVGARPKALSLADLFDPGEDARAVAAAKVRARLSANPRASFIGDPQSDPTDAALTSAWVLTPSGITFLIEPYAAGPYAAGSFFVKVPYSEFGSRLDPNGPLKPLLNPGE
jgi:hypothetical protein